MLVLSWIMAVQSALAAGSADNRVVSCMWTETAADERRVIAETLMRERADTAGLEARFLEFQRTCHARLGATTSEMEAGLWEFIGLIQIEVLRPRLGGAGVPYEALEAWYDRQSDEFQATFQFDPETPELADAGMSLFETLEAQGVGLPLRPEQRSLIARFLSAKILIARARQGLPIPVQ